MPSARLTFIAILCCSAAPLLAQQRRDLAADSAVRLVQRFYDWYVPRAANPRDRDMIMAAATHGPVPFDPKLVQWLRVDSTARARATGEIDGLDGDPYLNAQDPCDAYRATTAARTGTSYLVSVVGRGGCAPHQAPDVVVEIGYRHGGWTILEFRDPTRHNEGTIPLLKRLHPTAK